MADDEVAMIPRVLGMNLGISFFEETQDPVLVLNAVIPVDAIGEQLAHHAGVEGQCVVPLAFTAQDLQDLIPQIIEGVIRCKTVIEMLTTWPEQRDEIIKNLTFRWTGGVPESQDEGDGAA
jgi:hypothetical protein